MFAFSFGASSGTILMPQLIFSACVLRQLSRYFTKSWNTEQILQAMVLPIRAGSFGVGVKETPSIYNPTPPPKLEVIPFTSFDYPRPNFVFLSIRHTGGCLLERFYTSTYWLVTTFHAYPAWRNT